jgi:predicted trehalose synthase
LIHLILPSEGFRCGYVIPLIEVFPRVIDDLRTFTVGRNPETTRQRRLERLGVPMILPLMGLLIS